MSQDKLKPCPFCGGEASIISEQENFQIVGCRTELFMLCPTPTMVIYKTDGAWGYDVWNRRS